MYTFLSIYVSLCDIIIDVMKHFFKKIRNFMRTSANTDGTRIATPSGTLSEEEVNRRIDMAAEYTVKKYGGIIEKLSKE